MSERKTGLHPLKTVRYVILGVVLCLLVGLGGFLGGRYWAGRQESSGISAADSVRLLLGESLPEDMELTIS